MTDNTQELDEILTGFAYGEYSPHWTDERRTYTKLEAKQALLDWHKKCELEARIDEVRKAIDDYRARVPDVFDRDIYQVKYFQDRNKELTAELSQTPKEMEAEL